MKACSNDQIEYLERRLAFTENRLRDLTSRVSDIAPQALIGMRSTSVGSKELKSFAHQIVSEITDPDPDHSLTISAEIPCAIVRTGFFRGPISPIERWHEIVSGFNAMPRSFQEQVKELGLNPNVLPDWRQIQRIFQRSGFEAIPVYRAVGNLLFQYFISRRQFPVCTEWMMRYSMGPRLTIGDTFHEIGHGLAFLQPDYQEFATKFALNFLKTDLVPFGKKIFFHYVRALENSFVLDENQNVLPIGPTSYILDTLKVVDQKIMPRRAVENTTSLAHRPYRTYEEWTADCRILIGNCQNASLDRAALGSSLNQNP